MQKSHLCEHLLHPLLVGLDVLHLPLKTVLNLVLDEVDADPSLSVLDTFIIDPGNKEKLNSRTIDAPGEEIPEWPFCFSNGMLQL